MFVKLMSWTLITLCFEVSGNEDDIINHLDYCRERNRLIGTEKSDKFKLVEAEIGENAHMECHYCNEADDRSAKIWYRQDVLLANVPSEVVLEMASNNSFNRVYSNALHRLTIRNITKDDGGLYFCHGTQGQQAKNRFNYLLDLVVDARNSKPPLYGNLSYWRSYQETYLKPINEQLNSSMKPDFVRMRGQDQIQVEVISVWDQWGPCKDCKGPKGKRSRIAKCRLKHTDYDRNKKSSDASNLNDTLFLNVMQISCKSLYLSQAFPTLSEYTQAIPDFIRLEECTSGCAIEPKGSKIDKKVRYKKRYILAVKAHLTIVCPEASLDSKITWRKDGHLIDAAATYRAFTENEEEPRVTIDTFSTLYLHDVTSEEAGNYTCYVNNARIQEVIISVVSKTLLLTHAFLRHMAYIGLIFLLSFVFYCAGVAILFTRRHKFKDYHSVSQIESNLELK